MIYFLLTLTILSNAVMDAIMSNDPWAKYGLYFSRDGWKCKYILVEWLNKFLPLWLSKLLGEDVLVMFTDLWHTAKMIMILSFLTCIFGFTWWTLVVYLVWGVIFSFVYSVIR